MVQICNSCKCAGKCQSYITMKKLKRSSLLLLLLYSVWGAIFYNCSREIQIHTSCNIKCILAYMYMYTECKLLTLIANMIFCNGE